MAFENGLYVIRFTTPHGGGAGVATFHDGKVRGGDSMMAYVGSYNEKNGQLNADVHAYKHTSVAGMASVFGVDNVHIHLEGATNGGMGNLKGSSPEAPGVQLSVAIERLHD